MDGMRWDGMEAAVSSKTSASDQGGGGDNILGTMILSGQVDAGCPTCHLPELGLSGFPARCSFIAGSAEAKIRSSVEEGEGQVAGLVHSHCHCSGPPTWQHSCPHGKDHTPELCAMVLQRTGLYLEVFDKAK